MRKRKFSLLKRVILILFFGCAFICITLREADAGNAVSTEKPKSNIINLKVTCLLHALNSLQWKEEDLPASKQPVKCLVVGDDLHGFLDRLAFITSESGTEISGHPIEFVSVRKMSTALESSKADHSILILIVLDSVSDQWESSFYPNRSGFLVLGQSEKFQRKGMTIYSHIKLNRVKLSVNLKKAKAAGLSISPRLLKQKRVILVEED
jgi:hypothetical protein